MFILYTDDNVTIVGTLPTSTIYYWSILNTIIQSKSKSGNTNNNTGATRIAALHFKQNMLHWTNRKISTNERRDCWQLTNHKNWKFTLKVSLILWSHVSLQAKTMHVTIAFLVVKGFGLNRHCKLLSCFL